MEALISFWYFQFSDMFSYPPIFIILHCGADLSILTTQPNPIHWHVNTTALISKQEEIQLFRLSLIVVAVADKKSFFFLEHLVFINLSTGSDANLNRKLGSQCFPISMETK